MKLRGVIFDLDGTLGDTLPVTLAAFRAVFAKRLGVEYSDREIRAMFGPDEIGVFRTRIPHDAEGATEDFLAEYARQHAGLARPFEGIIELLDTLRKRGVACAVVTGKGARSAAVSLDLLGLQRYFTAVEAGSPGGAIKPEAMRRVLAAWGIAPDHVAGIGDTPSDVRAARDVGIVPLGAAWANGTDADALRSAAPEALFERVTDAHAWLLKRL